MLDPSTSRTLRIYPLETISRCEVSGFILVESVLSVTSFWLNGKIYVLSSHRFPIHLHLHFGPRVRWTLSPDVSDCNQIVILPIPFWTQ